MEKEFLIKGPISSEKISEIISKETENIGVGAQSIFIGQVRSDKIEGKRVSKICYTAYPEMVKVEIERIKDKIFENYPDVRNIEILHSKGDIKVGEISLIVCVSGGHRKETRDACNKTVDMIKSFVPIWKKEYIGEGEEFHWRENEKE
jgi:molybdopterin synthase catalytic subunit